MRADRDSVDWQERRQLTLQRLRECQRCRQRRRRHREVRSRIPPRVQKASRTYGRDVETINTSLCRYGLLCRFALSRVRGLERFKDVVRNIDRRAEIERIGNDEVVSLRPREVLYFLQQ